MAVMRPASNETPPADPGGDVDRQQIAHFVDSCFADGVLRPDLRRQVVAQMATHLGNTVEDGEAQTQILADFHQALEGVEQAAAGNYLEDLLLPLEPYPEAEGDDPEVEGEDAEAKGGTAAPADPEDEVEGDLFSGSSAEETW